jgi:hypothetical protein
VGWVDDAAGGWVPNPYHKKYPFPPEQRSVRDDYRTLDENAGIQKIVSWLAEETRPYREAFLHASDVERGEHYDETYNQLRSSVLGATAACNAFTDVPSFVIMRYLIERTIEDEIADLFGIDWNSATPVWLRFDRNVGEFTMRFSEASYNERRQLNTLIQAAQVACGYRKPQSGNDRRRDDETTAEQMRLAAKLYTWGGFNFSEIGEFFEVSADTAARYVKDGNHLLEEERGKEWQKPDPPRLKNRAIRLNTRLRSRSPTDGDQPRRGNPVPCSEVNGGETHRG